MSAGAFLTRQWSKRAARERLIIGIAGTAILLGFAYWVLLGPGRAARQQLAARLPVLRAQLDDMRRQQTEILRLRKKAAALPRRPDLRTLLEGSAARTSFAGSIERMESVSDGKVNARISSVAFDEWLAWIASLQRDFGVRVDACRIDAPGQPGLVRIEASFASARVSVPRKP